jgi:predicted component of type VI protein secretion system
MTQRNVQTALNQRLRVCTKSKHSPTNPGEATPRVQTRPTMPKNVEQCQTNTAKQCQTNTAKHCQTLSSLPNTANTVKVAKHCQTAKHCHTQPNTAKHCHTVEHCQTQCATRNHRHVPPPM